jgi:hypothetical protein
MAFQTISKNQFMKKKIDSDISIDNAATKTYVPKPKSKKRATSGIK